MAVAVIMPRQGQSVESCIISDWNKKKGDTVKVGDVLCSYETDKASFELLAEADGILLDVFFNAGDDVPVLLNIAAIGNAGEDVSSFKPGGAVTAVAAPEKVEESKVSVKQEIPAPVSNTLAPVVSSGEIKISPRAKNTADREGVNITIVAGTGPNGRIIEKDVMAASETQARMTPLAKEIAAETGKSAVTGSGIGGKALASDIAVANPVYGVDYEDKKLSNVRKIIAKSMHESLQNSAQLTHHMGADVRKLLEFRNKVKKAQDKGYPHNITLNDMVCYCVIKALKKMPEANSQFLNEQIRTFSKVHLGLAVDTPRGLMVPCVRNADDLNLQGLSAQFKAIAESCKKGSVDPTLLQSNAASFTVSNLGNYGVEMFTPVINLPQVAILGVNTIIPRPADLGNGVYGFVPYIGLSLTYDHRALDGGPATLFLKEIKTEIENWNELI